MRNVLLCTNLFYTSHESVARIDRFILIMKYYTALTCCLLFILNSCNQDTPRASLEKQITDAERTRMIVDLRQVYTEAYAQSKAWKFPEVLKDKDGNSFKVGGKEVNYLPNYKSSSDILLWVKLSTDEYIVSKVNGSTLALDEAKFKALKDGKAVSSQKKARVEKSAKFSFQEASSQAELEARNLKRGRSLAKMLQSWANIMGMDLPKSYKVLPEYSSYSYLSPSGEKDWIYNSKGLGSIQTAKSKESKVLLISPESLNGKVIVACDDSSSMIVKTKDLKGKIDLLALDIE